MIKGIIIIVSIFMMCLVYSCCAVASIADDREEQLYKEYLKNLEKKIKLTHEQSNKIFYRKDKLIMKYAQIRKLDVANGVGIRTSLFVSGCHFKCPGCFNEEYQDFKYGNEFTDEVMRYFIDLGNDDNVTGYTILGGEPLDQLKDDTLLRLMRKIRRESKKDIWMWTGYTFENLNEKQLEIVKYVDILVDGQFIEDLKNAKLVFRGSENQRIIDVQKSLKENKVVLWEDPREKQR